MALYDGVHHGLVTKGLYWKGRMDLRPGCWAFALDPDGTGFHPQFPITQRISSAQPLLNFLCGNVVVFILFWFCSVFNCKAHLCFPWFLPFSFLYCNFLSFVLL